MTVIGTGTTTASPSNNSTNEKQAENDDGEEGMLLAKHKRSLGNNIKNF